MEYEDAQNSGFLPCLIIFWEFSTVAQVQIVVPGCKVNFITLFSLIFRPSEVYNRVIFMEIGDNKLSLVIMQGSQSYVARQNPGKLRE